MEMRFCTACGIEKPLDAEYFYVSQKQTPHRPTLYSRKCIQCVLDRAKERRQDPEWQARRREWELTPAAKLSKSLREKQYRAENPDHYKDGKLKSVFGITLAQYNAMLDSQRGVCKICGDPPIANKRLGIDHDHSCCPGVGSCGKCIRGLLCDPCNQGIGLLKDNEDTLRSAIDYLKSYR